MRELFSVFAAAAMLLACAAPAVVLGSAEGTSAAVSEGVYLDARAKTAFMEEKNAQMGEDFSLSPEEREEAQQLMAAATLAKTEEEATACLQQLASYGVFAFAGEPVTPSENQASSGADVTLAVPMVFYSVHYHEWTVTCGGRWNGDSWTEGVGLFSADVGEPDGFGVEFTDVGEDYDSYVRSTVAYLTDALGERETRTTNRADGNGKYGFAFQLQDRIYQTTVDGLRKNQYIGYAWYGACTYDSHFAGCSGTAIGYYVHTYGAIEADILPAFPVETDGISVA